MKLPETFNFGVNCLGAPVPKMFSVMVTVYTYIPSGNPLPERMSSYGLDC